MLIFIKPYDEATWIKLGDNAAKLVDKYPVNPSDYSTYDVDKWAVETFGVGSGSAYKGKGLALINEAAISNY